MRASILKFLLDKPETTLGKIKYSLSLTREDLTWEDTITVILDLMELKYIAVFRWMSPAFTWNDTVSITEKGTLMFWLVYA